LGAGQSVPPDYGYILYSWDIDVTPDAKFPKRLFVAKEGTKKHVYYGAEEEISKLIGFIDEQGTLYIATYELVEVKRWVLEEEEDIEGFVE